MEKNQRVVLIQMKLWVREKQAKEVKSSLGYFSLAHGAAIQRGVLSGESCTDGIIVIDVNLLTMSIETKDGIMSNIIPRNTDIPTTKTKPFMTTIDNQDTVNIRVFEGERAETKDNHFLGQFDLSGIPLAPRGVPQIDVTFDIDANGILNVSIDQR